MPSRSLETWFTIDRDALDQLEVAHRGIEGAGRGRRFAIEQVNQAYVVLLTARFQGFCRRLHSEAATRFAEIVPSVTTQLTVRNALTHNRKLDTGNPNPGNLGSDFGRFGIEFWETVRQLDHRNGERLKALDELTRWRNAIAHQDFDVLPSSDRTLRLERVRK